MHRMTINVASYSTLFHEIRHRLIVGKQKTTRRGARYLTFRSVAKT